MDVEMECDLEAIDSMHKGTITQRQILNSSIEVIPAERMDTEYPEFEIKTNSDWIALHETEISFTIHIFNVKDNKPIVDADNISLINYPIASVFNNISVTWNDVAVSQSTPNYAHRAYIEALLAYGQEAKSSWLKQGMFYKDTANKMDSTNKDNNGFLLRSNKIKNGSVKVRGMLHLDVFNQEKFLPNNSKLKLEIMKNPAKFILMGGKDGSEYGVAIKDLQLHVRRVQVSPDVLLTSARHDLIFPINHVKQRRIVISTGASGEDIPEIYDGEIPEKIAFTFIKSTAEAGELNQNPFNYEHFNIRQLELWVDGQIVNGRGLKFDFDAENYDEGYNSLIRSMGVFGTSSGIDVSPEDYKAGYTIFMFNLSPSNCKGAFIDPIRKGKIQLNLQWSKAPTVSLVLYVYLQFAGKQIILKRDTNKIISML